MNTLTETAPLTILTRADFDTTTVVGYNGRFLLATSFCPRCRRVKVSEVEIRNCTIKQAYNEVWITPRAPLTTSLSNIPCPDCRPTDEDKEELRLHHLKKNRKTVLPGLEAVKKYTAINRQYYALSIAHILNHFLTSIVRASTHRGSQAAPTD